jgi:hypothetical protein
MHGKFLRKVAYISFFSLLLFAVQWGVLPPVVRTAQAQSPFNYMDITRMLDCGVVGSEGYERCKEEKEEERDKKCDESKEALKRLEKELADAYRTWQISLKTYRCNSIKGIDQGPDSKSNVDKALATVKDIDKKITEQLSKGKENCAQGKEPSDPRDKFEGRQCGEAKIDLACYQEKKDNLLWELKNLDDEEGKCTKSGTSEGYRRCNDIKEKELPDVNLAINKAEQQVVAENRKRKCSLDN